MSKVTFNLQISTSFLKCIEPPPTTLKLVSFKHSVQDVFQVSMQHLCLFIYRCFRNGCHWLLFLGPNQVFLPLQLSVIVVSFTPLATLAPSMASLCFKIMLQKHSLLFCLRDAFCHAEVSAWKGRQLENQVWFHRRDIFSENILVENWIVWDGRLLRNEVWLYL